MSDHHEEVSQEQAEPADAVSSLRVTTWLLGDLRSLNLSELQLP